MQAFKDLVCLDIGGTTIKSGLCRGGVLTDKIKVPTDAVSLDNILRAVDKAITVHRDFSGVAVSSAGDIDAFSGKCLYATDNLPDFTGLDLKSYVENKFKVKCEVINDAHAALLGEVTAAKITKRAAMLTLGTGVGGAYFDGADIVFGADFRFGRWGHTVLRADGLKCNCGNNGCIESYISATALQKRCSISLEDEFKDNRSPVLKDFIDDLCDSVKLIYSIKEFDVMIIGGGVAASADMWIREVCLRTRLDVRAAALQNDAGMIGAYEWYLKRNSY